MKRSAYFYTFLLLGLFALIIDGLHNYFWIMMGILAFSSVVNFVVFLFQTRVKTPASGIKSAGKPIDFYKTESRQTYYIHDQRKQANAE